ncbi:hypothetical protein PG999_007824 [Apiospora kogelbergensis]|uniref:Uncharacterized protein n=1 Tax=Apiospora kogelbergensis TaxID=1337665 RepID=A0AAW0QM45_9PEZI
MPAHAKNLSSKVYHGFNSGMYWETIPEWDSRRQVLVGRALLLNPAMRRLYNQLRQATKIPGGLRLPNFKKATVSEAFGQIYEHASYNASKCQDLDPVSFFAEMKKPFSWATNIDAELIWKFTYRALMARNIFLECQPGAAHAIQHPMVRYLDQFKESFFRRYSPMYGEDTLALPEDERDPQKIMEFREVIFRTQAQYFPVELTCAEYQGDGTDKVVAVKESDCEGSSTFAYMFENMRRSNDPGRSLSEGIQEGWLREDGSANPDYNPDWLDQMVPEYDSDDTDDNNQDEYDEAEEDEEEEEYQQWLHDYEQEYDIRMGRHQQNPEEDDEMSGVLSNFTMENLDEDEDDEMSGALSNLAM